MASGSCFCGKTGIKYTGEVQGKALCHCTDCQKITGSAFSTNIIVPEDGFSVTGTPKTITRKGDSGRSITSHFCGDCGTTLFREGEAFPGARVVKAGILDSPNALNDASPGLELFVNARPKWQSAVGGAAQKKAMPDGEDA